MLTKTSYGLSTRKFKKAASVIAVSICSITSAWAQCSAPSVSGTTICAGQLANLTPSPIIANTSYDWYSVPTGGTVIQTANSFTPQLSATTTYYVAARTTGCTSARTAVTVNVNPLPADGFFTVSPTSICPGDMISYSNVINSGFTVSVSTPSTYTRLAGSCGSTSTSTGCSGTMSATGTYTATATTSQGCSKVINQTVTVNPIPTVTAPANLLGCYSTPLSITASTVAGATYSWTGPNNFTATTTNPTVTVANSPTTAQQGTYTVMATVNGCKSQPATASVNAVFNNTVTPVISTATCFTPGAANTPIYVANTNGTQTFTWALPGNFTQTWSSATGGGISGTFAAATNSQFSVYYTNPNCPQSPTTTFTMYPNPVPAITAPKFKICKDDQLQLAVTNVSGGTWSITAPLPGLAPGATTNSTISATGLFSGSNPGVFTIRYTVTVNGCTGYSEQNVTVGALPFTINGPDKVCSNNQAVYTVYQPQQGIGNVYTWNVYQNPNIVITTPYLSAFNAENVTLNSGGTAPTTVLNLTATGTFECIAATGNQPAVTKTSNASKLVTVAANPSNLMIICADGTCNQLTVVDVTTRQPVSGLTYLWSVGSLTTQTITNPKNNANYYITCTVKNANGCSLTLGWQALQTCPCGGSCSFDFNKASNCNQNYTPNCGSRTAESKNDELLVYPNPVGNSTTFVTEGQEGNAYLHDLNGVVIKTIKLTEGRSTYDINTSTLQSGMYLLRVVSSNGESHTASLIKE